MGEKTVKAIHYIILSIIGIAFVLPLVWLVVASFDLNANQALKWPETWTLSNYIGVLTNADDLRGFGVGGRTGSISSVQISSEL